MRLILGGFKRTRSSHLSTRILTSLQSLNLAQSCVLSRWSQKHLTLLRLCPWSSSHWENGGHNMHSKDRGGDEEPLGKARDIRYLTSLPHTPHRTLIHTYVHTCVNFLQQKHTALALTPIYPLTNIKSNLSLFNRKIIIFSFFIYICCLSLCTESYPYLVQIIYLIRKTSDSVNK